MLYAFSELVSPESSVWVFMPRACFTNRRSLDDGLNEGAMTSLNHSIGMRVERRQVKEFGLVLLGKLGKRATELGSVVRQDEANRPKAADDTWKRKSAMFEALMLLRAWASTYPVRSSRVTLRYLWCPAWADILTTLRAIFWNKRKVIVHEWGSILRLLVLSWHSGQLHIHLWTIAFILGQ